MALSTQEIDKVAHLARLSLSAAETPAFAEKLASILSMIEQIQKIPTNGIIPMSHPLPKTVQRLRPDEVTEVNVQEAMLALAPQTQAGLYLVPKVLADKA